MNQHYQFYTGYYKSAGDYKSVNGQLVEAKYVPNDGIIPLTSQSFILKTLYPGVLAGIGYMHEWGDHDDHKEKNEEVKLGFSFDYVTGLPYIPGSSVKGVLRSCFKKYKNDIASLFDLDHGKCEPGIIEKLEKSIFGSDEQNSSRIAGCDVFLDCYPVFPQKDKRLLGEDYITSHRASDPEYDGLVEPNPVKMLKVLPGVSLLFRFILKDTRITSESCDDIILSADTKLELFKLLLCRYGVGAKTNVGYGRLKECNADQIKAKSFKWLTEVHLSSDQSNIKGHDPNNDHKTGDVTMRKGRKAEGRKNDSMRRETATVTVKSVKPDNNKTDQYVAVLSEGGMAFNVPGDLKKGDSIIISVTKREENRVFGRYVQKA